MTEVLVALGVALAAAVQRELLARGERQRLAAALLAEQERVGRLTELLMAQQAPQPYAAYMDPTPPPDPGRWLFSEDGLVGVPYDPED